MAGAALGAAKPLAERSHAEVPNGAKEPSARKARAVALKQNARFQEIRARIAEKSHRLGAPAPAPEAAAGRPVAAPLRRVDVVEPPPKYRNEVWFNRAR